MALDEQLLREARDQLAAVSAAEGELVRARAAGRAALRALHTAGGSLREIGVALGMSHERLRQLVDQPAAPYPGALRCSFCGADQAERYQVVAGQGGIGICEHCSEAASTLLEGWTADPTLMHRLEPALRVATRRSSCSFCAKKAGRELPAVLVGLSGTAICGECLALCHEIYDEEPEHTLMP